MSEEQPQSEPQPEPEQLRFEGINVDRIEMTISGGVYRSPILDPLGPLADFYVIAHCKSGAITHKRDKEGAMIRRESAIVETSYIAPAAEGSALLEHLRATERTRLEEARKITRLFDDIEPEGYEVTIATGETVHSAILTIMVARNLEDAGFERPQITEKDGKILWLREDAQIELRITSATDEEPARIVDAASGEIYADLDRVQASELAEDEEDSEPEAESEESEPEDNGGTGTAAEA